MKRDINFTGENGQFAAALGIDPERGAMFAEMIMQMVDEGASLFEIITILNNRGDMTDAEWTVAMFNLGHFIGFCRGAGQ